MTPEAIAKLLQPYVNQPAERGSGAPAGEPGWPQIHAQLAIYLELVLKWNARINLTAIRTPEEIVRRHFGESLFAGLQLGEWRTLLDFGSGAGFPGIPIQLLRPDIAVTLAESQGKKAAFLREAVRSLGLTTEVWAGRVESMPAERQFDTVALRAVDHMDAAVSSAELRASHRILILTTSRSSIYSESSRSSQCSGLSQNFHVTESVPIPVSKEGMLFIASRR